MRNIQITPVLNGFIVNAGCKTVVFTSAAQLGAAVIEYYTDPVATEKRYLANPVNKDCSSMFADGEATLAAQVNTSPATQNSGLIMRRP